MNELSALLNDNNTGFESLRWIIKHSDDGLFLVVASARMQRIVAEHYLYDSIALFDYSREERPFRTGSFTRLLEKKPGKQAYFFLNFQLAIPELEDVKRFNFCRDILAQEKLNLVFFVNQEAKKQLNNEARDIYSFFRLIIPFEDEFSSEPLSELSKIQLDQSRGVVPPTIDYSLPNRNLLTKAIALENQAKTFEEEGRYQDAVSFLARVVEIRKKILGEDHQDTIDALFQFGSAYFRLGKYAEAENILRNALELQLKTTTEQSPQIVDFYSQLGLICQTKGETKKALHYLKKALEICEEIFGAGHPNTNACYANLALLYGSMGDYAKAADYFSEIRLTLEKSFGATRKDDAANFAKIALEYGRMGDYSNALLYFKKALDIYEKDYGPNHPYTATGCHDLAAVYYAMGDYTKALNYSLRAHAIYENVLGKNHPFTNIVCNTIATIYRYGLQQPEEARFWLDRAIEDRQIPVPSNAIP